MSLLLLFRGGALPGGGYSGKRFIARRRLALKQEMLDLGFSEPDAEALVALLILNP